MWALKIHFLYIFCEDLYIIKILLHTNWVLCICKYFTQCYTNFNFKLINLRQYISHIKNNILIIAKNINQCRLRFSSVIAYTPLLWWQKLITSYFLCMHLCSDVYRCKCTFYLTHIHTHMHACTYAHTHTSPHTHYTWKRSTDFLIDTSPRKNKNLLNLD